MSILGIKVQRPPHDAVSYLYLSRNTLWKMVIHYMIGLLLLYIMGLYFDYTTYKMHLKRSSFEDQTWTSNQKHIATNTHTLVDLDLLIHYILSLDYFEWLGSKRKSFEILVIKLWCRWERWKKNMKEYIFIYQTGNVIVYFK